MVTFMKSWSFEYESLRLLLHNNWGATGPLSDYHLNNLKVWPWGWLLTWWFIRGGGPSSGQIMTCCPACHRESQSVTGTHTVFFFVFIFCFVFNRVECRLWSPGPGPPRLEFHMMAFPLKLRSQLAVTVRHDGTVAAPWLIWFKFSWSWLDSKFDPGTWKPSTRIRKNIWCSNSLNNTAHPCT